MQHWIKTDHRPGRLSFEALGLAWLSDAGSRGARVVRVCESSPTRLSEEALVSVPASLVAAEDFGRALAWTHASGASHFGAPPPGYSGWGWMGEAPLPLFDTLVNDSWGAFYAEYRLLPYVKDAPFSSSDRAAIDRLCERLASGDFDHSQPMLVTQSAPVARTHGDLWSGNVMWTEGGAVLIDPAAQGGHAEEDLAALGVFGCPYLERIFSAYHEVSPLEAGWVERIDLHRLHILFVHAFLFGGAYVRDCMRIVRRFVKKAPPSLIGI